MSKTTWHKGAPPSIGWWPASTVRDPQAIRWYNGANWSAVAFPSYSAKEAAKSAKFKFEGVGQKYIEWADRWWL